MTNHSTLGKNYSYDADGNMLARGSQTLAWTIDNRVASVSISGGGTTSMEYDYSGMRVKKSAPAGVTLYPFAGYEIDPNGVVTKFIRAGGESIASKKGANKYFYHNDHLGSVNVVTDATGVRVQLNEYDPWGAVSRASGNIDPDTRFTGQKLDPETGLYFYNGRYYDAEIGRFVSADPFVQTPYDPQNLNRYSYVVNSPQNYVDPDGYFHRHKKNSGFFDSWFGKLFSYFLLGPYGFALQEASNAIPHAGNVIAILGGLVSLASGNPFGIAAIASGALGFCQNAECVYASLAFGTIGTAGSFAGGGGDGIQTAGDVGTYGVACTECIDLGVLHPRKIPNAARAAAEAIQSPVIDPVGILSGFAGTGASLASAFIGGTVSRVGGAAAVRAGQAGEAAVRSVYDIGVKEAIKISGRTRIPDGINRALGTLSEVKNSATVSFTRQLHDYLNYANQVGLRFNLYVKDGARISSRLLEARDAGQLNIIPIP